ncbi:hypothetical protein HYC85_003831 [Camellia sinensis]|uniref:F-box domain-containing protein n=1 Tax=Camellia sinensis TaxID=4442 RepID=A0A7J7HWW6_CAMSI|nr:hypothetical protein HYC85_003831 [Camellia sinensis]
MKPVSKLHEDNVLDILHKLPAKSLVKFKCVSRGWREYISSPSVHDCCRSRRWKPTPHMMGFFFQEQESRRRLQIRFLFSSTKKEKMDNDLDESVSFLGRTAILVASSNGFLLCNQNRNHQMRYYIYNPATKQWAALPKPPKCYRSVATGFVCNDNTCDPYKDSICYKVVRFGIPKCFIDIQSIVTIECFSSETGAWMTVNLIPDVPLPLFPTNDPAVVIDEVFYWLDIGPRIIACDMVQRQCWVMNFPGEPKEVSSMCLAVLNGHLHYGIADDVSIEIWSLEGDFRCRLAQWHMKHRVRVVSLANRYPEIFGLVDNLIISAVVGFHPADEHRIVYLNLRGKVISYHINNGIVEVVHDFGAPEWMTRNYKFFPYE